MNQEPDQLDWLFSPRRFAPQRVMRAVQAFVQIEASSGMILLLAAIVALVWANSPWQDAYFDLWQTNISLDAAIFNIEQDLQHWVNDGLMTIFFFLAGLEIKRELVHGELSSVRRAALPAAAALGGMIVPALIYAAFNTGGPGMQGWGIPMATDIAFALGVLSLLSRRIPFSIKVFLLALAIADDIGAILVIAVFYTDGLDLMALGVAAGVLALIVAMNRSGVRAVVLYVVAGALLWAAVFESGIHATLAGVTLGLLVPARPFYDPRSFSDSAAALISRFTSARHENNTDEAQGVLWQMEDLAQGTEAPLDRLERQLHPWVSYVIVPVFALANAGVTISGDVASAAVESPVTWGVAMGLLIGKPIGIFSFTWLAVRLRLCDMPAGASWSHIFGVGLLGGIGFTVSLLITDLAFESALFIEEAKLGILCASIGAGLLGFGFLWLTSRRERIEGS